jgi:geranylgeranyl diphosphate synthase type I
MTFQEFQTYFNPHFQKLLAKKTTSLEGVTTSKQNKFLLQHIEKLGKGGKRIRPYLVYLSYVSGGGKKKKDILPYLLSIELIHLFALIHDDVMDCAHVRRGVTTIHHAYYKKYCKPKDTIKNGESMAILAGDLVYAWAIEQAFTVSCVSQNSAAIQKSIVALLEEVVLGQVVDITLMKNTKATLAELAIKNHLKTASYTFIRPIEIGLLASGNKKDLLRMKKAGSAFGEAFQIQDDYLDVMGDPKITKKELCVDIAMGQPSLMSQFIFDTGTAKEKAILKKKFGKTLNEKDIVLLQNLFETSGAVTYAKNAWGDALRDAATLIDKTTFNVQKKKQWLALVDLMKNRIS